jgi:hypothetical protein
VRSKKGKQEICIFRLCRRLKSCKEYREIKIAVMIPVMPAMQIEHYGFIMQDIFAGMTR